MKSVIKNNFLYSLYILLSLSTATTQGANVIFDLGGVLVDTNMSASFWHLGPKQLLLYFLRTGNSPYAIKLKLYEVLGAIEPQDPSVLSTYDNENLPMPLLMVDWLTGMRSNKEILSMLKQYIHDNPDQFLNNTERQLVASLANMIFNPKHFVNTRRIIKDGVNFVKKCKDRGHNVYVLSNWDQESFQLLRKKHKRLFNLFDGIMISGEHGLLKPNPSMYQNLLSAYNLNPYESIFIDDQKENIIAARQNGIAGIHHTKTSKYLQEAPDFDNALRKLIAWESNYNLDANTITV